MSKNMDKTNKTAANGITTSIIFPQSGRNKASLAAAKHVPVAKSNSYVATFFPLSMFDDISATYMGTTTALEPMEIPIRTLPIIISPIFSETLNVAGPNTYPTATIHNAVDLPLLFATAKPINAPTAAINFATPTTRDWFSVSSKPRTGSPPPLVVDSDMYGSANATSTMSAPKRKPPKEATSVMVDTVVVVAVFESEKKSIQHVNMCQ